MTATCCSTSWRRASRCSASSPRPTWPRRPGPAASAPRSSSSAPPPAARSRATTAGLTWWPRTTSSPTCRTSRTSRPGCARWSRTTGMVTLEFPHLLRLIERRQYDTIYHEHFSYLSLLTSSRALSHGRAAGGRRGRTLHPRRLAARLRPARGGGRRAGRDGQGGAGRRGGRRACTPSRATRASRAAVLKIKSDLLGFLLAAAATAGRWPATAPPARATRCSTTAASGPTCSPTRSTAARSSKASSCPARIFRSTRRSGWPRPGPTTYSSCRGTCGTRSAASSATSGPGAARLVFPIPELEIVSLGV